MKNTDIVRKLKENGFWLKEHGGNHDRYTNGKMTVPVPRHREVKEGMAQRIFKEAGIILAVEKTDRSV